MRRIKEHALREFGDEGAETLERYFAQVEYAAYWCIRLLHDKENIISVIPEGVEDVVIERESLTELHQVKTRDESRGHWNTSDVLPIFCQQYNRRKAFSGVCEFHFASDQMADTKTKQGKKSYGPLFKLKYYLGILHDGQPFKPEEQTEFAELKAVVIRRIQELMRDNHNEDVDENTADDLLLRTWVETDSLLVRKPDNVSELQAALDSLFPGGPTYTYSQLHEIYDRLLLLIIRKIITTTTLRQRRISREDVLNCRTASHYVQDEYPDLDTIPGATPLDKKAHLGGFDATEFPTFHRQKVLAEGTKRRLVALGLANDIERLTVALLDCHRSCRHEICRRQGVEDKPGPKILDLIEPKLGNIIEKYFPQAQDVDEQFCKGIIWGETNACHAWWHELKSPTYEVQV